MNETWMQTHGLMYEQHAHDIHMPSHIINNEIVMFMNILFSIHLLFAFSDQANMLMCIVNEAFAKYEILTNRVLCIRVIFVYLYVCLLFFNCLFSFNSLAIAHFFMPFHSAHNLFQFYIKFLIWIFPFFCSLALHISVISSPVFVTLSRMCAWNEFNEFCKWNSWFSSRKLNVLKSTKLWF